MPFLKSIVDERHGRYGHSWTDTPTESRPAHVAVLAGTDEDPTSLYNGWKDNGKRPDNVLRRAPFAAAIGAPDVVGFFGGRGVYVESFAPQMYGRAGDVSELDEWTRDTLRQLAKKSGFKAQAEGVGSVLFLHLAGVDTAGHRHGSQSAEYAAHAHT